MGDNIISVFQTRTRKLLFTFELPVEEEIDNIIRVKCTTTRRIYCLYRYDEEYIVAHYHSKLRKLTCVTLNDLQEIYAQNTKNLKDLKKRNLEGTIY